MQTLFSIVLISFTSGLVGGLLSLVILVGTLVFIEWLKEKEEDKHY